MEKVFIIAQKFDDKAQQADAVVQGVTLARQLAMSPEIFAYSYAYLPDFEHFVPAVTPVTKAAIVKQAHQEVAERLADVDGQEIPVHSLWHKHLYEHACEYAAEQEFSLMIKAVHDSDRFMPTDWHLIRHTQMPLLFLKPQSTAEQTVLVALDLGSKSPIKQQLNKAALAKGRALASACGGDLHVAYVCRMHVVLNDLDLVDNRTVAVNARERLADELAQLDLPPEQIHVLAGDPEMCLYELSCRLKSRYFVIGARQRKGILGHVIGNTAEAILSRMRCDVLVVPAFDERQA